MNKPGIWLGVWLMAVTAMCPLAHAQAPAAGLPRTQIAGRDYVRLADWARRSGFSVRWLEPGRRAVFTAHGDSFTATGNAALMQYNGINLWLNYPIAAGNGTLWISELDARTTLQPLATNPKYPGGRIKTIIIDPGHGGTDTGNQVGRESEKKYTLLLSLEVRDQLKAAGFAVKLTRTTDKTIKVWDRPDIVNSSGADLFLCLHFNATSVARNEVRGSEVYCVTPAGAASTNSRGVGADSGSCAGNRYNSLNIQLAYHIQKALLAGLGSDDRGVRRARFQVLRESNIPAVLVEAGYMSHPVEGRKIFDPNYRREMARAIVSGVLAYRRSAEARPPGRG